MVTWNEVVFPRCPMIDPRKHNYQRKVMELIEQGKVPPGCVREVDIYHDDWCRIYRGGYCNCDPVVRLRPPPEWN
jgi:hypothetical protein